MRMQLSLVLGLALVITALGGCAASGQNRSTGEVMDDTSIAARVKSELLANSETDGLNIDVEVDRNRVQLNGFVNSQAQINKAGEIARSVSGVDSVVNNLRVSDGGDRMTGEYIDDKALQASINTALANDPLVSATKVDVEVNRGEVSLGGYVDSTAARNSAASTTSKVNGVVKVINNLKVR